jgi:hypothetical protein
LKNLVFWANPLQRLSGGDVCERVLRDQMIAGQMYLLSETYRSAIDEMPPYLFMPRRGVCDEVIPLSKIYALNPARLWMVV